MKRTVSAFLILCVLGALFAAPVHAESGAVSDAAARAQAYLVETKPILDETDAWLVIAAARADQALPKGYFAPFAVRLREKTMETDGVLHESRASENAYAALALAAIGENPSDFGGSNLLLPLADFELVVRAGVTGAAYALAALDAAGCAVPIHTGARTQATREAYVTYLLQAQNPDGGWSSGKLPSDAGVTAVILQALAPYQEDEAVRGAISRALACLSSLQEKNGGFSAKGVVNAASCAQVILAMCALDVEQTDARFVKNGKTALDALLSDQLADGSFRHAEPASDMVTAQALLALSAVQRAENGQSGVFEMTDAQPLLERAEPQPFVTPRRAENGGAAFLDTAGHANRRAIETLAGYGVISGKGDGRFSPDETMTRAQFAKIVVDGLGLLPEYRGTFTDVDETAWYAGAVDTAAAYGIVTGTGDGKFSPESTITRQEAAAMLARAAKLCGFDTALTEEHVARVLARYSDGGSVAAYARGEVAFCAQYALLPDEKTALRPNQKVLRGEVAQMLCRLLEQAGLLQ